MNDKEIELYFICCLARDRGIKAEYFDFDKRCKIIDFTKEKKEVNEDENNSNKGDDENARND